MATAPRRSAAGRFGPEGPLRPRQLTRSGVLSRNCRSFFSDEIARRSLGELTWHHYGSGRQCRALIFGDLGRQTAQRLVQRRLARPALVAVRQLGPEPVSPGSGDLLELRLAGGCQGQFGAVVDDVAVPDGLPERRLQHGGRQVVGAGDGFQTGVAVERGSKMDLGDTPRAGFVELG